MATTAHYGWEKPTVGGDADTWGTKLNTTLDDIDTDLDALADVVAAIPATVTNAAPVGSVQDFLRKTAPTGWTILGGTIGNASSGATLAHADTQNLFNLLWAEFDDSELPVLTSAGGASTRGPDAATDWAANKRLTLTAQQGKFRRSYGTGSAAIAAVQQDAFQGHYHAYKNTLQVTDPPGVDAIENGSLNNSAATGAIGAPITDGSNGTPRTADETRPINIAYLTCIKL